MEMPMIIKDQQQCTFEHGMSKAFVLALREIFDVLEDKKSGAIEFSEIACKWVEDDLVPDLPKGLIKCLQKVTPPNGLLTFDRFCAGVRICLLKNQADFINNNKNSRNNLPVAKSPPIKQPPVNSPSHLMLKDSPLGLDNDNVIRNNIPIIKPTASVSPVPPQFPFLKINPNGELTSSESSPTVHSNNFKTKSMPQLQLANRPQMNHHDGVRYFQSDAKLLNKSNKITTRQTIGSTFSKSAIMKTLLSWRDNVLRRQTDIDVLSSNSDGKENYFSETELQNRRNRLPPPPPPPIYPINGPSMNRSLNKRREPRRHTVGANGIDYNMIKRMQQIEQEREILLGGLNAVHQARDWYLKHIAIIQDKLRYASRDGSHPADYSLDAYQERINFLGARIVTVNQHLAALMDSDRGFPIHMNLAMRSILDSQSIDKNKPQLVVNPNLVNRLKEQNKLLTDEVGKKSERITQLEREKSALIRELFQARAHTFPRTSRQDNDDTTFM